MRNRTRQQSMADRHDYGQKAEKTQDSELVSSFMCSPETAAEEFELSKRLYFQITGRSQPKGRDVKQSAMVLLRLNDELCRAHGLSVIENPKPSAKKQKEMAAAKYGPRHKERLRQTIDRLFPDCRDYDDFLARMRTEGYEIAGDRFDEVSRRIKQLENRMAEAAQLKTHIINYSKTREVYAAYKKSRHKKEFLAEHGDAIAQHEAAKKAFDALGGKPVPKAAQLSEQYAALLAEKQEQNKEQKPKR